MYIEKYGTNCLTGGDDSLTLMDYLASRRKAEISFAEIFDDFGLEELHGDFQQADSLTVVLYDWEDVDEMEVELYYAIDLIADLASLLLECRVNGNVVLSDVLSCAFETDEEEIEKLWGNYHCKLCITATPEEYELIDKSLKEFVAAPLENNLSDMMSEEEMQDMAAACEAIRKDLKEHIS